MIMDNFSAREWIMENRALTVCAPIFSIFRGELNPSWTGLCLTTSKLNWIWHYAILRFISSSVMAVHCPPPKGMRRDENAKEHGSILLTGDYSIVFSVAFDDTAESIRCRHRTGWSCMKRRNAMSRDVNAIHHFSLTRKNNLCIFSKCRKIQSLSLTGMRFRQVKRVKSSSFEAFGFLFSCIFSNPASENDKEKKEHKLVRMQLSTSLQSSRGLHSGP